MFDNLFLVVIAVVVTRGMLVSVRRLAMRRRVWFKVLSRMERAVVSLTIRCVEEVRSVKLAMIVKAIVDKLKLAVEGGVERLMDTVGRLLAQKLSGIAVGWGNESACRWVEDCGFIQFLTVNYMNTPSLYRV